MHLPPLNALRAFEAAGRYQNFSRAADELNVTQGAVSRHVKLLEEHLGVALFRRRAQGLELTEQGRALLPEVSASFERLAQAAGKAAHEDHVIRIIVPLTLATRWLIPRLSHFQERYPDLHVSTGLFIKNYDEFYKGNFDIGIDTFEQGRLRPSDFEAVLLRREALTPVCSPALLNRDPPLAKPSDLAQQVLLHPLEDRQDWRKWLRTARLAEVDVESGEVFQTMEMALRAAVGGLGVAIGDLLLIEDELVSGQLVAPFDLVLSEETGYFLFCRRARFREPKLAAFRDWLIADAEGDSYPATSQ